MNNEYSKSIDELNQLFIESFTDAYKKVKTRGKNKLLRNIASMYKRWTYTTLINDTVLSPANLFYMINREHNKPLLRTPSVRLKNNEAFRGFDFDYIDYSLENHPVVKDLKIFIESCIPDVELDNNDMLAGEHMESLLAKLSIWDPFYVEYLLLLCIHMNIIKKIPSIYSNRAVITADFDELAAKPEREILDDIIKVSATIATSFLSGVMPSPKTLVNPEFILSLLKNPISTDDIFRTLYESMGIKIEDILTFDLDDKYEEISQAIMSSTFFLGIILDKYFFTPFGHYLKLIRPLYALPYEFTNEMTYMMDSIDKNDNMPAAVYAPCSNYYLTELGIEYFNVTQNSNNFCFLKTKIPLDIILQMLLSNAAKTDGSLAEISDEFKRNDCPSSDIYEIKIRHQNNRIYWKNLELPSNITLHMLFSEICFELGIDMSSDYSFFTDTTENQFSQYTSSQNPRRSKKAHNITLEELNFEAGHKFILAIYNTYDPLSFDYNTIPIKVQKLELEMLKIKQKQADKNYPRVSRVSQAYKEFEEDWEF